MRLLVTEHAATICGVILGREHVVAAAARRVRDDLVEGLLLGRGRDDAETGRWAAHLGYDAAREHNVMAIAFDLPPPRPGQDADALRQRVRDVIEHFFATRSPDVIISARESEVVLVARPLTGSTPDGTDPARLGGHVHRPAGRAVPGHQGGHRDRRALPEPAGDRPVLRGGAPDAGDAAPPRPDRRRHRLRRPRYPPAAAPGARPGRAEVVRGRRARHACAVPSGTGAPSTSPRSPATCGRTAARSGPRGTCTSTRTPSPTGSSGSRRSPGCRLDSYRDRLTTQVALEILDALGDDARGDA